MQRETLHRLPQRSAEEDYASNEATKHASLLYHLPFRFSLCFVAEGSGYVKLQGKVTLVYTVVTAASMIKKTFSKVGAVKGQRGEIDSQDPDRGRSCDLALYPGLPLQLFLQPWKKECVFFYLFHGHEKNCRGRPGYEASCDYSTHWSDYPLY